MFEKFAHKGTWDESLHIFLFHSLYILDKPVNDTSIEEYNQFELKDTCLNAYNDWIEKGCIGVVKINEWLNNSNAIVVSFKSNFGSKYKPKVELWSDRSKTNYYKEKLQASFDFENYIEALFKERFDLDLDPYLTPEGQYYEGENGLGIEIKNDTLIKKYGNVYIEYAEKSKASNYNYVASGILKDDKTTYFLIGDKDGFWIFRKSRLVEIYNEEVALSKQGKSSARGIMFKQTATSKGIAYPVRLAKSEALTLEELVQEIKSKS